jgi:hypothetical protein
MGTLLRRRTLDYSISPLDQDAADWLTVRPLAGRPDRAMAAVDCIWLHSASEDPTDAFVALPFLSHRSDSWSSDAPYRPQLLATFQPGDGRADIVLLSTRGADPESKEMTRAVECAADAAATGASVYWECLPTRRDDSGAVAPGDWVLVADRLADALAGRLGSKPSRQPMGEGGQLLSEDGRLLAAVGPWGAGPLMHRDPDELAWGLELQRLERPPGPAAAVSAVAAAKERFRAQLNSLLRGTPMN